MKIIYLFLPITLYALQKKTNIEVRLRYPISMASIALRPAWKTLHTLKNFNIMCYVRQMPCQNVSSKNGKPFSNPYLTIGKTRGKLIRKFGNFLEIFPQSVKDFLTCLPLAFYLTIMIEFSGFG